MLYATVRKLRIPKSNVRNIVKEWKDGKILLDIPKLETLRKTIQHKDALIRRKLVA